MRDFKIDVGETVRIYGLLNALASSGHEVIFISNARRYEMFHASISHICVGYEFKEKRKFQSLLALFPYKIAYNQFKDIFSSIEMALQKANIGQDPVYFFDYLDNSFGYLLKKKKSITKYINDVHGIATLEFQSHVANSKSVFGKFINRLKYYLVDRLDNKVFEYADGLIYGSENMRKYYEHRYNLENKKACVMPYLLSDDAVRREINSELRDRVLREWGLQPGDFVMLFVGTYKPTAGVDDLILAFDQLFREYSNCKLFLIGNGPSKIQCLKLADELKSKNAIRFIDSIPYNQLVTYQSLGNVIVCPDKDNPYSHYVIHVKYFDALISGRLVINGAFESVKEINPDDCLSLTFEPSNIDSLYDKLKLCRKEQHFLEKKYIETKNYVANNLTYHSFIYKLINSFKTFDTESAEDSPSL
jgi:glycosyltransferase involved in cell wall biosynthesis